MTCLTFSSMDTGLVAAPLPHILYGLTIPFQWPSLTFAVPVLSSNLFCPSSSLPLESVTRCAYTLTTDSKLLTHVQVPLAKDIVKSLLPR